MTKPKKTTSASGRETSALARLVCPGCKVEHTSETLACEHGFGCCKKCQAVFVVPEGAAPAGAEGIFQSSFGEPSGIEIVRHGDGEVTASWRYERQRTLRMALLAVALLGGCAALVTYSLSNDVKVWPLIVAFPLLVFGSTLTYTVLITLVQWQRLEVRSGKLAICSVPLPIPGSRAEFDAASVTDVYVRLRLEPAGPAKNGEPPPVYAFYDVRMRFEKMDMPIGTFFHVDRALAISSALREALPGVNAT